MDARVGCCPGQAGQVRLAGAILCTRHLTCMELPTLNGGSAPDAEHPSHPFSSGPETNKCQVDGSRGVGVLQKVLTASEAFSPGYAEINKFDITNKP